MGLDRIKSLIINWNLDEALTELQNIDGDPLEVGYLESTILIQKGRYQEALQIAYETLDLSEEREDFTYQSKIRMNISYTLWWLGNINELDKFLTETEIIYHQIPEDLVQVRLYWQNFLNCGQGMVLWRQGMHDEALSHLKHSLDLSDQINEKQIKALATYIIGLILQSQGKLQRAEDVFKESLNLYQSINSKLGIIYCMTSLGVNYYNKGRLETALDFFVETLQYHRELGNRQYIAYTYDNIGLVYESLSNYEKAHTYLNKAITIRREIGNDFDTAISLLNLVRHGLRHDEMDQIEAKIQELELIAEINNNSLLDLRAKLAKAMYYKEKRRFNYIIKAKDIFTNILSNPVISFELTIETMLNYCELLLMELRVSEDRDVISQIIGLLDSMRSMAELYQSYSILIEVIILQSKLAIIEGNIDDAQNLLEQAKILSKDRGLSNLEKKVKQEIEALQSKFLEWKQQLEDNASVIDKLKVSSIIDYLGTISSIDLNSNVPDSYGDVARVKKSS